jgi:hypothetical protein
VTDRRLPFGWPQFLSLTWGLRKVIYTGESHNRLRKDVTVRSGPFTVRVGEAEATTDIYNLRLTGPGIDFRGTLAYV